LQRVRNSFLEILNQYNWVETKASILQKTKDDVAVALNKSKLSVEDFKALISPSASPFLEQLAAKSKALTLKRFGKTIQMFIPMYLSNECQNICTYCGFSMDNKIPRITLSNNQILNEVEAIKKLGYKHILLLTGEAKKLVGFNYILNAVKLVKPHFENVSLEVQPLKTEEYKMLKEAGLHTVLVYQETYNKMAYKQHHTKGRKSNFEWRLATPERLGKACMYKIGIGALLGLSDWRTDSFMTALHLDYLQKKYWQSKYTISFPRLRPCEGNEHNEQYMTEKQLVQLICAYRLFNEDVELSLSTRESANFRNNIVQLGITSMSAESKTNPGGYATNENSLEQFEIDDTRPTAEIASMIKQKGYETVWKDWDAAYQV